MGVAEESAIGVAVEGDAEIELAGTAEQLGGHVLGMKGSAAIVDVAAIRRGVEEFGGDADTGEKFGSYGTGGSIGAVDEDMEGGEAGTGRRVGAD
jgi:hypothetical protein